MIMKKFVNLILSIFSPLAAVPTGWAIYAGVTEQPAFPMNPIAAAVGAIAVIATSIQAGGLITDIKAYNQGLKNKTEQDEFGMSSVPAWLIFGGCTLAEIVLSLLIVVIPGALAFGVLVFPLMTAAGVFAFAVRFDLQKREQELAQVRAEKKKEGELAKARRTANKSNGVQPKSASQSAAKSESASHYPRRCEHCPKSAPESVSQIKSPNAVGGHMKKHHPELCKSKKLAENFFEKVVVK